MKLIIIISPHDLAKLILDKTKFNYSLALMENVSIMLFYSPPNNSDLLSFIAVPRGPSKQLKQLFKNFIHFLTKITTVTHPSVG